MRNIFAFLFVIIQMSICAGATRTVSPSGTDSGNCVASACLTLQYAITQIPASSQGGSGDTIIVEDGTYTGSAGAPGFTFNQLGTDTWNSAVTYAINDQVCLGWPQVCYVSLQNANLNHQPPNATWWNTSGAPGTVTIKARNRWGAKLQCDASTKTSPLVYTASRSNVGVSNFVIDGFDMSGCYLIFNFDYSKYVTIQNNLIHDAGNWCAGTQIGYAGYYASNTEGTIIRNNIIYNIGRKSPDQDASCWPAYVPGNSYATNAQVSQGGVYYRASAACTTCASTPPAAPWVVDTGYQNLDHGIYTAEANSDLYIYNNIFYNNRHGWGIQVYASSGADIVNLNVINNTFVGSSAWRNGAILLAYNINGLTIRNNLFGAQTNCAIVWYTGGQSIKSVVIDHNISMSTSMMGPNGVCDAFTVGYTYAANDVVYRNGVQYISKAGGNLGNTPPNATFWDVGTTIDSSQIRPLGLTLPIPLISPSTLFNWQFIPTVNVKDGGLSMDPIDANSNLTISTDIFGRPRNLKSPSVGAVEPLPITTQR